MKRPRIKIPNLPACIIKQGNGMYRDMKTLKWYTLKALQSIYADKHNQTSKQELSPDIKDEIIRSKRYDLNY